MPFLRVVREGQSLVRGLGDLPLPSISFTDFGMGNRLGVVDREVEMKDNLFF